MITWKSPFRMLRGIAQLLLGISQLRSDVNNRIDNEIIKVEGAIDESKRRLLRDFRHALMAQRRIVAHDSDPKQTDWDVATVSNAVPLEDCFRRLEEEVPAAYAIWRRLLDVNADAYDGFPIDSCSVENHPVADEFAGFLDPYLRGRVLDIGCGPQPVPWYLRDYPPKLLYGIDPISDPDAHPFHFRAGVSEFLPWADDQFHVVVAATSLDHVLLPDRSLNEIHRVLAKPDGRFVTWISFVDGAAPYDPYCADVTNIDAYHLFHFDLAWFEKLVRNYFEICESFAYESAYDSCFYCLRPK